MLLVTVTVPQYIVQLALNCSTGKSTNPGSFCLLNTDKGREIYAQLMRALKSAPDSAFHIWTSADSNITRKANEVTEERVSGYLEKDWGDYEYDYNFNQMETQSPDYWSIESVIRSIADGNGKYKNSFFGTTGKDKGKLFHMFQDVDVGKHTTRRKERILVKFIAPGGVIDEKDVYDKFESCIHKGKPDLSDRKMVKSGNNFWEVVSFHGDLPGESPREYKKKIRRGKKTT